MQRKNWDSVLTYIWVQNGHNSRRKQPCLAFPFPILPHPIHFKAHHVQNVSSPTKHRHQWAHSTRPILHDRRSNEQAALGRPRDRPTVPDAQPDQAVPLGVARLARGHVRPQHARALGEAHDQLRIFLFLLWKKKQFSRVPARLSGVVAWDLFVPSADSCASLLQRAPSDSS